MIRTAVWKGVSLATIVAALLASSEVRGANQGGRRLAYPLYCAGIVVGMSSDTDVRRMYGDGFFVREEGHLGGRYFTDPKRQVTLHVEIGVDQIIETVSYARGVHLPSRSRNSTSALKQSISSRLTPGERLTYGTRLGDA